MQAIKKTELRKKIAEIEVQIEIEAFIRAIVEKFKHHKKITSRFIDAIKEVEGYHAWIVKDYAHKISVSKTTGDYQRVCVELYVYGKELTWDILLRELDRYAFTEQLERHKEKLIKLDADIETLKEIYAFIEGKETANFSLSSIKCDLEHAIKYSGE